jgi:membrane protein YqaA with SNARE-associated domain
MTRRVMLGCAALSPYLLEKRTLRPRRHRHSGHKKFMPFDPASPRSQRRATRRLRARWRLTLKGPLALPALFLGSIVESSILPWPIEFPMLAYMLRGRIETLVVTLVVTLGSVVGCLLSYAAGRAAFGLMADFIAARPGLAEALAQAQAQINEAGAVAVSAAMMTPTPVQITSFAAGVLQMSPLLFALAVFAGRSIRYWSMGLLVFFLGERIMQAWRKIPAGLRRLARIGVVIAFVGVFAWTLTAVFGA